MAEPVPGPALFLTLGTPQAVLRNRVRITTLRASDASGSFGIRPGHEDLLTVLGPGVVYWEEAGGAPGWCAVDDAVLRVQAGRFVEIAAQEALEGPDRQSLEARVLERRQQEADARLAARSSEARLQAQAVRKLAAWLVASARGGANQ